MIDYTPKIIAFNPAGYCLVVDYIPADTTLRTLRRPILIDDLSCLDLSSEDNLKKLRTLIVTVGQGVESDWDRELHAKTFVMGDALKNVIGQDMPVVTEAEKNALLGSSSAATTMESI